MSEISFENVNKFYGDYHALKSVNLDIEHGQIVTVVGASGSGKSTLIRCVNGLETYEDGYLKVFDTKLPNRIEHEIGRTKGLNQIRRNVGMVFQQFNLFPHLTVADNVSLALRRVLRKSVDEAQTTALEKLGQVGLADHIAKYPSQLSGGQQQRVAIARALALEPKVMLFDEPTSSLDPEMVGEVLGVIKEMSSLGITMLIVTHEMDFAIQVSHHVIYMDSGSIIETGSPEEFFRAPKTERARNFLKRVRYS